MPSLCPGHSSSLPAPRRCPIPLFKKDLGREEFVQKLCDQNKCFENAQSGDVGSQGGNGPGSSLCLSGNRKSTNGPVQCSLPGPIGAGTPALPHREAVNIKYHGIPVVMGFVLLWIKLN